MAEGLIMNQHSSNDIFHRVLFISMYQCNKCLDEQISIREHLT